MLMKQTDVNVTLLVHLEITIYKWGKELVDLFKAQAIKKKCKLHTVYEATKIKEYTTPIIIVGVNSVWLNEAIEKLKKQNCKLILIYGATQNNYEKVSCFSIDQHLTIQKTLNLLYLQGRTRPAFFGLQKNDTSDQTKALTFAKRFPHDIYTIEDDVSQVCDLLISKIDLYDSVICANDVIAIYLLSRLRRMGISVPNDIYLVGNGNIWLSAHVTPSLTTAMVNTETIVKMAFQAYENLCEFKNLDSLNVSLAPQIIQRNSTSASQTIKSDSSNVCKRENSREFSEEKLPPEFLSIVTIDRVFSSCSDTQKEILRFWIDGVGVEEIAEKLFISDNAVKYHLKTLYKKLGIHSKKEFLKIIDEFGITF